MLRARAGWMKITTNHIFPEDFFDHNPPQVQLIQTIMNSGTVHESCAPR
jgi:hypothetical protein